MRRRLSASRGFTLLELVVVIAVLALVANLATEHLVQVTDQQRYETSRDRLQRLQYAIVGDDSRTSNGQPDLFGFVHDMGRPPVDLSELYEEPADCDPTRDGNQSCPAGFDPALGRSVGWRGPYISARDAKQDGWGNPWQYDSGSGRIVSLGADDALGGEGPAVDQMVSIQQADHLIRDAVGITLTSPPPPTSPLQGICLTATHIRHGEPITVASASTFPAPQAPGEYWFQFDDGLPIGRLSLSLREVDGADCTRATALATWTTTVYPRRALERFSL